MVEGFKSGSLGSARDFRERQAALERFALWAEAHTSWVESEAALSGVGLLYDLLPAEARRRPVDPSGVRQMHRCLALLGAGSR